MRIVGNVDCVKEALQSLFCIITAQIVKIVSQKTTVL